MPVKNLISYIIEHIYCLTRLISSQSFECIIIIITLNFLQLTPITIRLKFIFLFFSERHDRIVVVKNEKRE